MSAPVKSIFLEDFQSHAKSKLELAGPGSLTVIVGPTDSGKTAVVRGLRWLFYGIPQGFEFIRVGRSTATVALELEDGTKIVRERSKAINRYRIVKPSESPTVLEGFGNSVPLEVQQATGVRTVTIGDLELALNLSEQLDGPFLGNKQISGPTRAKVLGKLAGTEEVDEAQRTLGTDLFRASQEEKRLLSEIETLDAKIREYDYLPALAEKIASLEALLQAVREAQDRLASLEWADEKLANIQAQRAQALSILARWKNLREAEFCAVTAEGDAIRLNAVVSHKTALDRVAADCEAWARLLTRWINLSAAEASVREADSTQSRLQQLRFASETLQDTQYGLERVNAILRRWANLSEAATFVSEASETITQLQTVTILKARLNEINAQRWSCVELRCRWAGADAAQSKIAVVATASERLQILESHKVRLARILESRIAAENALAQHTKALADARKQYTDTLLALGKCPLCGSQVDPELVKEVA